MKWKICWYKTMETYIAILRGINVSGQKKINMNDLKNLFAESGFKNIRTYIQSGNVVFNCDKTDESQLARKIGEKITEKYNFAVPVIIRTAAAAENVLKRNPLLNENNTDKLHVTFLAEVPKPENVEKIKGFQAGSDRFSILGREIYLYCPDGYGNTKLSNNFFENKLKVTATTRNWRTVNELYKITLSQPGD
jgi:uncharacterized protein (DUF1697 family)